MKRSGICFLILVFFGLVAASQETWKGLRFGMTVAQVRAKMRIVRENHSTDAKRGEERYDGPIVVIQDIPMASSLDFSPTLSSVQLSFSALDSSMHPYVDAAEDIATDLKSKYGPPVEESASCTNSSASISGSCSRVWSYHGQSIRLTYLPDPDDRTRIGLLLVIYQRLSADL